MLTNPQRNCGSGCIPFFISPITRGKIEVELILKSNRGLHVRLSADDAEGLLKVSQLCELLEEVVCSACKAGGSEQLIFAVL